MRPSKSVSREQVVFAAVVTIVPILLCGFMFGFDIPLASAEFWRVPKNDMIAMTAAYEAYIRQPWSFPLTMVSGLTPQPVSIVFTDSIPWLAIVLKASGLGPYFNPLGVFLMLSYPLQAWSMVALLRALDVRDRLPLAIGALMALAFPSWIARQFGHIALSGHWLILFSLALAVSSARKGLTWKRVGGFAVLAALAVGVHAYHLAPIAACFGAALLAELLRRREGAWTRVPIAAVVVLASVILPAFVLGYGRGGGATGGAAALGFYAMNLLGPIYPQASTLMGQHWNGEWFIGTVDPTGGQSFEGYQYLGAGVLLLLAAACVAGVANLRAVGGLRTNWTCWGPLALAMLGLTLWAVGWEVYLGSHRLASLPRPGGAVADIIGAFRCHGRFFWAPGYLLMALGVASAARLPGRTGVLLLSVAALLQAVDTSDLRRGVLSVFHASDSLEAPANLFTDPAIRGRPWVFAPTYFCSSSHRDLRIMSHWLLAVVRTGGTSSTFPTARSNDPPCDHAPADIGRDAAPDDRRITVVMSNGLVEGGDLEAVAGRSDCYRVTRGVVCGRDLQGLAGLTPLAPGDLAGGRRAVTWSRLDRQRPPFLRSGWGRPQASGEGIWTQGRQATFVLAAPPEAATHPFFIDVVARAYSDLPLRPRPVALRAGGRLTNGSEVVPVGFFTHRFKVPAGWFKAGEPVLYAFDIPSARPTAKDPDARGIVVQQIWVRQ